jgi:hypothetical protein
LALALDNKSPEMKKSYRINNRRLKFDETVLIRIEFNVTQNIIVNYELKQLREITENTNGSIVAHSSMIVSFEDR